MEMQIYEWNSCSSKEQESLLARPAQDSAYEVEQAVKAIMDDVKEHGDAAVRKYMCKFDRCDEASAANLELTSEEIAAACARLQEHDRDLCQAIEQAYTNIYAFHKAQTPVHAQVTTVNGISCECATHAIEKVGLYVPGGSAPLVSTALMLGVPAQIAGCEEVILTSPNPLSDAMIYAAHKCGISRIFKMGGAHAIAAMAYGTESVPKVYKIFGPGNQFVTKAKQLASEHALNVMIDMPAGPSEVLVIADQYADADFVAADLLSQAEHGPDSQVILVSSSKELLTRTQAALKEQLEHLPRRDIALQALSKSRLILTSSLEQSIDISNRYAPEHLIVQVEDPRELVAKLKNAGSIFLGRYTCESMGDYASGTNHTLPTYGYATAVSALGTDDFRRRYTISEATQEGLAAIGATVEALAHAEGLDAHRNAVTLRLKKLGLPSKFL